MSMSDRNHHSSLKYLGFLIIVLDQSLLKEEKHTLVNSLICFIAFES